MENRKQRIFNEIRSLLTITAGSIIFAVGIVCFLDSNNIAAGGIAGLAMIICRFVPIDIGLMVFLLNVPIFIAGYIRFRGRFFIYTLYAMAVSSASMDLIIKYFPSLVPLTEDLMLAAVAGGAIMALGIGLVNLGGGSMGGTDIIIKFIRQRYVHVKTGMLSTIFDLVLALIS